MEGADSDEDLAPEPSELKPAVMPLSACRKPARLKPSGVHGPLGSSNPNKVSVSMAVSLICRCENSKTRGEPKENENEVPQLASAFVLVRLHHVAISIRAPGSLLATVPHSNNSQLMVR